MPSQVSNTPPAPYKSWAAYYASIAKETEPQQTTDVNTGGAATPKVAETKETKENVYVAPKVQTPSHNGNIEGTTVKGTENDASYQDYYEKVNDVGYTEYKASIPQVGSFGAWYKTNYGEDYNGQTLAKTDSMSATDFAVGQNLYYTEQADKSLKEDYDNNLKEIAASQSKDEQQSFILYEKLKRYLGMTSAAQGKGVDSGDMIAANNNYQNALSGISDSYGGMKTDLTQGYNTSKLENSQQSQTELYALYAQQETDAEIAEATQNANDEQAAEYVGQIAYSHIQGMLDMFEVDENGNISYADYQSLLTYYEKYKSQMSEGTKKAVEMMLEDDIKYNEATTATQGTTSEFTGGLPTTGGSSRSR